VSSASWLNNEYTAYVHLKCDISKGNCSNIKSDICSRLLKICLT
jgi:hypothetical protein